VSDRHERQHPLEVVLRVCHDRAENRGDQAGDHEHRPDRIGMLCHRPAEDTEDHPHDAKYAEFAHRPREHDADRRGRHGVRIREPQMERHDRRLDEEPADEERQRDHNQPVDRAVIEDVPRLRDVQRSRARVHERHPDHRQE
jgi:hypothetical protein